MNYRQANAQDLPQLVKLRWEFRAEDGEVPAMNEAEFSRLFLTQLEHEVAGPAWIYFIAEDEGVIVSQIFLQIIESIPRPARFNNRFGYLTNIYTTPDYRKQGIGAKLMQQVIEYASQHDLELLLVWPSEASVNFYSRAGFQLADDVMKLQLREY